MVIIDTGPIVALFDESEPMHRACKETLRETGTRLLTSWPVMTEAFYLLGGWHKGQRELWEFIVAGGLTVHEIPVSDYPRLKDLMGKYSDRPMDLADATLVLIAETYKIRTVFTLDRDFAVYRPRHARHARHGGFEVIPAR